MKDEARLGDHEKASRKAEEEFARYDSEEQARHAGQQAWEAQEDVRAMAEEEAKMRAEMSRLKGKAEAKGTAKEISTESRR